MRESHGYDSDSFVLPPDAYIKVQGLQLFGSFSLLFDELLPFGFAFGSERRLFALLVLKVFDLFFDREAANLFLSFLR